MKQHWPVGVHSYEEGWKHVGSFQFEQTDEHSASKGDVYICLNKKEYDGVSVQMGPEEHQYISGAPAIITPSSPVNAIRMAYAMQYDRHG